MASPRQSIVSISFIPIAARRESSKFSPYQREDAIGRSPSVERAKIWPGGIRAAWTMSGDDKIQATVETERALLAVICQSHRDDSIRRELFQHLEHYDWQSSDCRAIYEAIVGRPFDPSNLRGDLPARLTRIGFPDIDFNFCFEPPSSNPAQLLHWLRSRISASSSAATARRVE
jgi:hypothetical protein